MRHSRNRVFENRNFRRRASRSIVYVLWRFEQFARWRKKVSQTGRAASLHFPL
jgi:hypothetical protein